MKILKMSLTTIAALLAGALPSVAAQSAWRQSQDCFFDIDCPVETAENLAEKAWESKEDHIECTSYFYGIGVRKDLVRAASCFEAAMKSQQRCNGGSPSMYQLFLASIWLEGLGVKPQLDKASELMEGCNDMAVGQIKQRLEERKKGAPPLNSSDFCPGDGGTTMSMQDCNSLARRRLDMKIALENKNNLAKFSPEIKATIKKTYASFQDFLEKSAKFYSDQNRDGSIRAQVHQAYYNEHLKVWQQEMESCIYLKPTKSQDEKAQVAGDKQLNDYYSKALVSDEEAQNLLKDAQKAWLTYRDAVANLYVAAYSSNDTPEKLVHNDVVIRLTKARARDLRPRK